MNRILIVDDNEHIARMMDEVLTSQGYSVEVATTGKEALHLIDTHRFEVAFVDLELDDMCGLNVLCYMKNKSPETVSTVISGKSNIDYAADSIKTGAFRYLKKPFNIDALDEVVRQSLEENEKRAVRVKKEKESQQSLLLVKLLSDLALLIPVMFLGFLIQKEIYYQQELAIFWGNREMIYIISSFAFCYAFIFTSSYGQALREDVVNIKAVLKSYGSVFMLFAGILFFVTDFFYGRLVLLSSFVLGLPALYFNRKVLWAKINKLFMLTQEGPHSLTFKTTHQSEKTGETTVVGTIDDRAHSEKSESKKSAAFESHAYGVKINESDLGTDWGSRLIREFRNNRLKRAIQQERKKIEKVK